MILHDIEMMDRTSMKELQFRRLKETLARVYHKVSFYQQQFDEAQIVLSDFQSLHDIVKLPFTRKEDLRTNYPFGLFAVEREALVRIHCSSGTSGKPTVVGYTKQDIENWEALVARAITTAGGRQGGCLHNAYGYGLFTGGLGLHYGSEKLGMATVPVSGGNTLRQIMLIEDFEPTVICGTPSYILNIAETMETIGKDPRNTSLQYGILGAEPWSEEMRKLIEQKLAIKACDIYGLSEVLGPGIAMECHEAQDGLHVADDHFFIEVIDPISLKPLKEGEEGELIITSLTKEAFPVIRYRTGDIASITTDPCVCGRTTTRMSKVKGRTDDMVIIRGVNIFPSEIENYLLQVEEIAPHYQLYLKKENALDIVDLHVEVKQNFYLNRINKNISHSLVIDLAEKIKYLIKNYCLIAPHVTVLAPNSIPRFEGKAIRVVDHRNKTVC